MPQIRLVDVPAQRTAVVREQVSMNALPEFFDRVFHTVAESLARRGVPPVGAPFALYHGTPRETVDVEAGFPVDAVVDAADGVVAGSLPACRAVQAVHLGPYDALSQTSVEVARWMREHDLQAAEDMWGQYLTDPTTHPDPATWRTHLVCPVR